jgi:hypothetical protein
MEPLWSTQGSHWVSNLSEDQKDALKKFFLGTPDEALLRLKMRKLPPRLRRATLEGYLTHVIEPALKNNDPGRYTLQGKACVGMQAFRKQLVKEALPFLA